MTTSRRERGPVGRGEQLETIEALLRGRRHVILVGPEGIGKTALVNALNLRDALVIDPLEHVSAHRAAHIRRAMGRDVLCLAATRSLSRAHLGSVGRIAWRFTTVRVPPLSGVWIRRLLQRECTAAGISDQVVTGDWMRAAIDVAQGRPGVALAIVREAARIWRRTARVPSPAAAYLEVSIRRVVGQRATD